MVRVTENHLIVGRSLQIPLGEIELRASRSSGPGGQHANKTSSRVDASYDVLASSAPGDQQRARIIKRAGPIVRATAQDARSQARNRDLALTRLGEKLESALSVRRTRVATKPSKASKERRLQTKRSTSETKAKRQKPRLNDDQ